MGIMRDVRAVFGKDPAAKNVIEVLLCYPGVHAIIAHRFIHVLHRLGIPLLPRFLSQVVRFLTGVEIHPGAKIGNDVVIDHGMGVVIGETSEIGDGVLIYQGVTLGGVSMNKVKRHPTIGKDVVLGAGSKLLGAITIGENSLIGASAVVVKDVPPGSTVVGVPGKVISRDRLRATHPQEESFPDPDAHVLQCILTRLEAIEKSLPELSLGEEAMRKKCVFRQDGDEDSGQCLTSR